MVKNMTIEQKSILETTYSDPYENEPRKKFMLMDELHNGTHFCFISKWRDMDGTETFWDLEKALKQFLKRVARERKCLNYKNMKIQFPTTTTE